jgi:DNA repair exonuclease SbcCD nuclease subunit
MKVLHTADTHIGSRQYGLEERRADFSKAFHHVIEIAIEEKVDAVVHAGDLFDDRYPTAEDLHETLRTLFQLKEADIPFLGVVGNHEQRRGVQWLDLFAQLGLAVHLNSEPYERSGWKFYGMDYAGRRDVSPPRVKGGVLVCHQLLDRIRPDGELRQEDLWKCGAQYVLLGDYHEHQIWREGTVLIAYPGSTERWSLDEREPRGVSLLDLDTGRLDRRELATRRFLYISEEEDPIQSIDAHREQLRGAVVCVYLARDGHRIQEIEEHARSRGALTVRVRDHREAPAKQEQSVNVQLEFGNLDALISERLAQLEFSKTARDIDSIIRHPKVADSRVDEEVTRLLEAAAKNVK